MTPPDHHDRPPMSPDRDDPFSCLVLHGLGGGPYEVAPLIEALKANGVKVAAPILPGHEGPGPVMPSSSWRDWIAAAIRAFDELAAEGAPVAVVGFSTGGTLALELSTLRPVTRQVLLAPFLAIRFSRMIPIAPALYLRPIARVMPNLWRRPPAVQDRLVRRQVAASSGFRTFSLGATLSALELIERVKPMVPTIATPTLILQGRRDTVVEPRDARWLLDHLGSSEKELVILPRSDHLLAYDRDRDEVIGRTLAFLRGRDPRPAG